MEPAFTLASCASCVPSSGQVPAVPRGEGPRLISLQGHSHVLRRLRPAHPHWPPSKGGEGAELLLNCLLPLPGRTRLEAAGPPAFGPAT